MPKTGDKRSVVAIAASAMPVIFAPLFAHATTGIERVGGIIVSVGQVVSILITTTFGLALALFFWGLAKYILNGGDEKKVAEGRRIMIWGTLAIFVASSVWGIVVLMRNVLDLQSGTSVDIDRPRIAPPD